MTAPSLLHSDMSIRLSGIPDTYDRSIVDRNLGPQESDVTIYAHRSSRIREQRLLSHPRAAPAKIAQRTLSYCGGARVSRRPFHCGGARAHGRRRRSRERDRPASSIGGATQWRPVRLMG